MLSPRQAFKIAPLKRTAICRTKWLSKTSSKARSSQEKRSAM